MVRVTVPNPRQRARMVAAAVAIALHIGIGLLLLRGRTADSVIAVRPPITFELIENRPEAPPPPPLARRNSPRPKDAAAPPNLRQEPSPIVAPPPIVPVVVPPPVITAPIAGMGTRPDAGAAAVEGPGTGASGTGNGRGGGGTGGPGEGDDGYRPPKQTRGRIGNGDYPTAAEAAAASGRVSVRYLVGVDGRVSECAITRSSGNAELDATTCRLITERFRFRPSRGPDGRPVASLVVENHSWFLEDDQP